ncbi:type III secretion system outer membrane ring subunit SctC [Pseudomonas fluorescens]|uniref:Type 3 secretion system secretin n=1 Tax=Pseudomonas fluorescens TaxID=294 RepID=A0A423LHP4_PSEFL|nr:type III secretion system outer membrane ring subunit SctC [Pseudomonas fluorescens]RON67795.1 EscC/YscC/HrcC family type III secretion system outer membrane ring protein [Pseudomonas fluorescens]
MASLSVSRYLSLVVVWLLTGTAHGQDLDWPAIPYNYVAQGENLRDVLANFGANYDGSVIVSDKVNDQVSGRFDLKDPQSFVQLMASLYNLIWYYDGAVLYVFKSTEMQSRLVKLEQVSETELRQALEAAGVWEPRFGWRPDMSGRLVYVSGPSRYLDLVEQTAMALEQQHALRSEKTGDLVVEIFPLKYAVAEDRRIKYREDDIEAPGVATILARVLGDANVVAVEGQDSPRSPAQSGRAVVQAEPSLNAILVRDTKERMPMYRRLITALDRPSARIEVGLSIVDINAENLAELGVDWRVGISVGPRQLVDIRTTTENLGGPATTREAGASLVDSRGLDFLLARITLLQNQGRAQIGSRPTVLTQENTLAVIDHSETYYVRLVGERVAELRPITYGTMLKLTPRVIQLGDKPEISLSLHIEDGNQKPNSSGPGGLPTIARTVVDTVARVGHGQSLLIGGIYRDELSESMRKVPLLGDIPYLGALFRFKSSFTRRSVRLFLIEPRLIDNGLGHFVALGSKRGYMDQLLQVDELSNQSLSLQKLLGTTQCQALGQARELQQILAQTGKDSSLTACAMGNDTQGWRIAEGACVEGVDQCVRAPEKP